MAERCSPEIGRHGVGCECPKLSDLMRTVMKSKGLVRIVRSSTDENGIEWLSEVGKIRRFAVDPDGMLLGELF